MHLFTIQVGITIKRPTPNPLAYTNKGSSRDEAIFPISRYGFFVILSPWIMLPTNFQFMTFFSQSMSEAATVLTEMSQYYHPLVCSSDCRLVFLVFRLLAGKNKRNIHFRGRRWKQHVLRNKQ